MLFALPVDFQESVPFRRLAFSFNGVPSKSIATIVWVALWRELTYLARDGNPPGKIIQQDIQFFINAFSECGDGDPKKLFDSLSSDSIKILVPVEDGFFCPMFAEYNPKIEGGLSKEQKGAFIRSFNKRNAKLDKAGLQQTFKIGTEKFVDAAGKKLDSDMVTRTYRLVGWCDNALGKKKREADHFSVELIQNASTLAQKFTDDKIKEVLKQIVFARLNNKPGIPENSEKLLPRFEEFLPLLETK